MQSANYSSPLTIQGNSSGEAVPVSGTVSVTGNVATSPAVPAAANVLAGHLAHTSTTAAAAFLTVAAGKTWMGTAIATISLNTLTSGQAVNVVPSATTLAQGEYLTFTNGTDATGVANVAVEYVLSPRANVTS